MTVMLIGKMWCRHLSLGCRSDPLSFQPFHNQALVGWESLEIVGTIAIGIERGGLCSHR